MTALRIAACPRCGGVLRADYEDRDAGWCVVHGTVYHTPPPSFLVSEGKHLNRPKRREHQPTQDKLAEVMKPRVEYSTKDLIKLSQSSETAVYEALRHMFKAGKVEKRMVTMPVQVTAEGYRWQQRQRTALWRLR